jgi:hypothetical protein
MDDTLQFLILLAMVALLILLRFDARRFGAADYDDEQAPGGWRTWARKLTWYALGTLLVSVIYFLFPQPITILHLQMGEPRTFALVAGLVMGLLGGLCAIAYAWWRFGTLRFAPLRRYPAGVLNSVGTAFVDEAAFRGILLGLLLFYGWPAELAIVFQAVFYAFATRLGGPGRPKTLLFLSLVIGLAGGWLTVVTGGIGAAFLGHAITRFAIFLVTGHAGQVTPSVAADEEVVEDQLVKPHGWEVVPDRDAGAAEDPGPA